ncbi:MAG: ATP-binding cassette domain-containing protein, partial [Flavisolibacter sp.]|nr:ATP-binding cassette domain-containing protein [Flavisolibacter sp.]
MSLLEVSGISRQEEDIYVLKDISFTQHEFQNTAIAGATGSGKTTLLKIIAGLVQPHAGEVLFEGTRVKGPDEKLIPGHPRIAYLSQHF